MRKICLFLLVAAVLIQDGFGQYFSYLSGYPSESSEDYQNALQLSKSTNKFAINFYDAVVGNKKNKNYIMSSISAQTILSLLYCGAGGRTATAMANSLQFPGESQTLVAQQYQPFLASLQNNSIVQMANAMYLMEGYEVQQNFLNLASNDFYSNVETVNFADNVASANEINNWVSDETHGKITNLIPPDDLDSSTRLVLVNAIYFKGAWKHKFDKAETKSKDFHTGNCGDNEVTKVEMMHTESRYDYGSIDELNAQAVKLPYDNTDISMVILLPNSCDGLGDLEQKLASYDFSKLDWAMWSQKVILSMPKFKIETTLSLNEPLKKLGMSIMYGPSANFTSIIQDSSGQSPDLVVSDVVQKAYISVDEEGATAAAATGIVMVGMAMPVLPPPPPITFNANHPFIYLLKTPNEVLFMGKYVQ